MKKMIASVLCAAVTALVLSAAVMAAGVSINSANFPDANFRTYVRTFDTDKSGALSDEERNLVDEIYTCDLGISSLAGVEFFPKLMYLTCCEEDLTSLDLSGNPALTFLCCYDNRLTSLDLSGNPELDTLYCYSNRLTSLDVSGNQKLRLLSCWDNELTALDLAGKPELRNLYCYKNSLTSLDLSRTQVSTSEDCYAVLGSQLNGTITVTMTAEQKSVFEESFRSNSNNARVTVKPAPLFGDVNADGAVTSADASLLKKYLAGWNVTVDASASDLNGDGRINAMDSLLLSQYLAGWRVTPGR